MPKITVKGGASFEVPPEETEESCPGTSSSTSPESTPRSSEKNKDELPKPARTTGSRSKKPRTADSSAGSTGTAGPRKG